MTVILIRLVIVYAFLTLIVRFMGKRQIGEMQMSELIVAFMLSELAALPVTDTSIPLLYAIVPILLLAVLEILTSYAFLCSQKLARIVSGAPQVLIRDGRIDRMMLRYARMTLPELMGELRLKGIPDPGDVAWAILEENGKVSVIPKRSAQPPDARSLARGVRETGICHTLIADGALSAPGLSLSGHSTDDVRHYLRQYGNLRVEDVFLLTVDDAGNWNLRKKDETKGKGRGKTQDA